MWNQKSDGSTVDYTEIINKLTKLAKAAL